MLNKSATFCHPVSLSLLYKGRHFESSIHSLSITPFFKSSYFYKTKSLCTDHQKMSSLSRALYSTFLELDMAPALHGVWLELAPMRLKWEDGGFEDSVGYIIRPRLTMGVVRTL